MPSEEEFAEMLRRNPHLRIAKDHSLQLSPVVDKPEAIDQRAAEMSEKELQSKLRETAKRYGYLHYHTYDSRKSDTGFPDSVLLRCRIRFELYFVELKREGENPSEDQAKWLHALSLLSIATKVLAPQVKIAAFLWRPSQWFDGTIERVLREQ